MVMAAHLQPRRAQVLAVLAVLLEPGVLILVFLMAVLMAAVRQGEDKAKMAVLAELAQSESSGPAQLVASHQQIRETCNA